jgi:hypothetical protein
LFGLANIPDIITEALVLKRFPEIDPDLWIGEIDPGPGAMEPSTPSDLHRG